MTNYIEQKFQSPVNKEKFNQISFSFLTPDWEY